MNRTKKIFWESEKKIFSLTDVVLLALIIFTIIVLLSASFNRSIDNTITDSEIATATNKSE